MSFGEQAVILDFIEERERLHYLKHERANRPIFYTHAFGGGCGDLTDDEIETYIEKPKRERVRRLLTNQGDQS